MSKVISKTETKSQPPNIHQYQDQAMFIIVLIFIAALFLHVRKKVGESELALGIKKLLGKGAKYKKKYQWILVEYGALKFPVRKIKAVMIRPAPGHHLDGDTSVMVVAFLERVFHDSEFRDAGTKEFRGWNCFETVRKV
jgi:hypothetical protein